MLRGRAIRFVSLTAVLSSALLHAGPARALYRCLFDDVVRTECCCSAGTAAHDAPASVPVIDARCCEVASSPAVGGVDARIERSELAQLRSPCMPLALPRLDLALHSRAAAAAWHAQLRRHPPAGPPLLLRKCSLLV